MVTIYDINGNALIEVDVQDTSSSYRSIDGRHELTLKYSLESPFEIPLGSWCLFQNERFELMSHQNIRMRHTKHYEYTLVMQGSYGLLSRFKVKNPVDGRLKFDMVAKPKEYLDMIIANLNERDGGWTAGECIESDEKLISFNHSSCSGALNSVAAEFETEFEVVGKSISLKKVEYGKDNPLRLAYGKGNGLKSGVGRTNYEDGLPAVTMFVQGGSRNLSYKDYGSMELHLPKSYAFKFDGERFEWEEGFDAEKAREFATDHLGSSVSILNGKIGREDSIDLSEIYPGRVGKVSSVVFLLGEVEYDAPDSSWTEEDWNNVQIDIIDDSIPADLDYSKCLLENNEPLTVSFQSGELAGRDFDATFIKSGNRFQLKKQEYSGQPMPQGSFIPSPLDSYAVFNVSLPASYVSDIQTHSGAEFDALREATRSLYEKSDPRFTFSGEIDDIWSKKNWENVGGRLKIGSYVSFVNEEITTDGPVLVRIVGITQNVNNPHCPKIELSNVTHKGSVSSRISQIEDREAHVEELHKEARQFTKRRFADAQRAIKLLEDAFGNGFDPSIKPSVVQTMMMLVGDESLQFAFVDSVGSDKVVKHLEYFDAETKTFKCGAGILKHYTIDVNEISSQFNQQHRYWSIGEYESAVLDQAEKDYYVYAVVDRDGDTGEFSLESQPMDIRQNEKKYYLLLGLLLAERDGSRDYLPLYGFTQVLPGQITTDVIRSADGKTFFDLVNGVISGKIHFEAGSTGLENLDINFGGQNMLRNSGFTGDYLSEELTDETVLEAASQMYSDPLDHWKTSGEVSVVDVNVATTGKGVAISDGEITQDTYNRAIYGESYVVSFKAKADAEGAKVSVRFGENAGTKDITTAWQKYNVALTATTPINYFKLTAEGSVTICDLQLERGTVASAWGYSWLDNDSDRAYWQSMKYLQQAIAGSSTVAGGLILTNLIQLGEQSNNSEFVEKAGVSGLHIDDDSLAFWAGGTMAQAIALVKAYSENAGAELSDAQAAALAKFAVTHGGRAILNDMIVRGYIYALGGKIGGLEIKDSGIYTKTNTGGEVLFTPVGLIARQADGSFTELGTCGSHAIMVNGKGAGGQCYLDEDLYKIAAQINAANGYHAIHSLSGMYAGLRPKIRAVTASETLTELDHTLVVSNAEAITLTLPSYPQTGQTYKLIHTNGNVVMFSHPDTHMIIDATTANGVITSFNRQTTLVLTYLDGIWYAEFNN